MSIVDKPGFDRSRRRSRVKGWRRQLQQWLKDSSIPDTEFFKNLWATMKQNLAENLKDIRDGFSGGYPGKD